MINTTRFYKLLDGIVSGRIPLRELVVLHRKAELDVPVSVLHDMPISLVAKRARLQKHALTWFIAQHTPAGPVLHLGFEHAEGKGDYSWGARDMLVHLEQLAREKWTEQALLGFFQPWDGQVQPDPWLTP